MAETTVEKLSKTKQRQSLGASKKKEKNRKPVRTTVVNSRDIQWPDVDEIKSRELLKLIEERMVCLKIPQRHVPLNAIRSVPKEKRSEFRKQWVTENSLKEGYDVCNFKMCRNSIAIGVNCCTKGLDFNIIKGLIIEKDVDPQIITKLLIPIAHSKGVPIISVSGLSSAFKKASGNRCIALGFKVACEDIAHEFFPLLSFIKKNCVKIPDKERIDFNDVQIQDSKISESITSSTSEDVEKVNTSSQEEKVFSVQKEIEKLEEKVKATKRKFSNSIAKPFIKPKIRRVTPK